MAAKRPPRMPAKPVTSGAGRARGAAIGAKTPASRKPPGTFHGGAKSRSSSGSHVSKFVGSNPPPKGFGKSSGKGVTSSKTPGGHGSVAGQRRDRVGRFA